MIRGRSLKQWLEHIERTHLKSIDMNLTRIRKVFVCLQAQHAFSFDDVCVVTVAGTNGKGTTCRFIEQVCVQAGHSVGVYASPHIERFNERIRVDGVEVTDSDICQGFEWVEKARLQASMEEPSGEVSLTYFEYATLCAFVQFMRQKVSIWILEVGLGGRLDATNLVDANIAVITSIGLDHQAYLGDTTEQIAGEKAGIIKQNQDVVVGYSKSGASQPHNSVLSTLDALHAEAMLCEHAFGQRRNALSNNAVGWLEHDSVKFEFDLSEVQLPAQNIMTAIACLTRISKYIGASHDLLLPTNRIQDLIKSLTMPGRMQVLQTSPLIIVDVAHNQAAAEYLLNRLQQIKHNRCHIVIGMLKDKNVEASIKSLSPINPIWYCVGLSEEVSGGRGEDVQRLANAVVANQQQADCFNCVAEGMQEAIKRASTDDIILIVGSFIVASEAAHFINAHEALDT